MIAMNEKQLRKKILMPIKYRKVSLMMSRFRMRREKREAISKMVVDKMIGEKQFTGFHASHS